MHGHGSRPHLCLFPDCDRAQEGNGFPRRYNLFDHMKRVHDFTGPVLDPSPTGTQSTVPAPRKVSRKRRSTADEGAERKPKAPKISHEQQLREQRTEIQQEFLRLKENAVEMLKQIDTRSFMEKQHSQLNQFLDQLFNASSRFRATYKENLGG